MTTLWISIFKSSAKLKTTAKSQERKKNKTKSSIVTTGTKEDEG
jgi:hypothetical protein